MRAALALLSIALSAPALARPAPPFGVTLTDGRQLSLSGLRGRVVVLNLWASWCEPCKREVPLLNAYWRAHQADGLVVIAVPLDDDPRTGQPWRSPWIAYPQAARLTGGYGALGGVPTSYVIGRDGSLAYARAGVFTAASLATVVGPLLGR